MCKSLKLVADGCTRGRMAPSSKNIALARYIASMFKGTVLGLFQSGLESEDLPKSLLGFDLFIIFNSRLFFSQFIAAFKNRIPGKNGEGTLR